MATITLDYRIERPDNISGAVLSGIVAAADLFRGELDLLNMSVLADLTFLTPDEVVREIILFVLPAGENLFPNDADKIAATNNLYRQALAQLVPAKVTADAPIVIP